MHAKKLVSLLLTAALSLCLTVSAFADAEYQFADGAESPNVTLSDGTNVSLYGMLDLTKYAAQSTAAPDEDNNAEADGVTVELLTDASQLTLAVNGEVQENTGLSIYMLNDSNAQIRVNSDSDEADILFNNGTSGMESIAISSMERDDAGYVRTIDLTNLECGVSIVPLIGGTPGNATALFSTVEQAEHWLALNISIANALGNSDITSLSLLNADGGIVAEANAATAVEGPVQYKVRYIDESGAPVAGVMTQFCDDTTCAVAVSDAEGVSLYEAENAYAYEVHVLKVPEGYERVTDNFVMEANGGEIEVTLKKAA